MDEKITWRFPASHYGEKKGISSGDTEAFKKSPFQAFAREVLQNSIDARASDEEPTIVEFKEFTIETKDIPAVEALKVAINRCIEYWQHQVQYKEEYQRMLDILDQPMISCLRVSDYNTTGLIGVNSTNQVNNNFLALTKGTGVSEKSSAMAGGSKGVGKNAVFLMSSLRTVFYSTNANQDIEGNAGSFIGSIGVAEFVSGYVKDDIEADNRDYTQGTGYLSRDEWNNALLETLTLDSSQRDRNVESGTDIYILGFNGNEDWEKEVINSVLDSFMATIVRGELEVIINDNEISKNTIGELVDNENIIFKNQRANIVSQYRLLKGNENVKTYDIETDYGNCELYILPYSKAEDELATHKCSMIRHPLMKIKDEPLGNSFRVSALCIIPEGILGEKLREIENPQHIDWEPKRIKGKAEKKEIENILREIKKQINDCVIDCLKLGDTDPLDPNGAGDFLPDSDLGDGKSESNGNQTPAEMVSVSKMKENITIETDTRIENKDGHGLEPNIGEVDDEDDGDVYHPVGENNAHGEGRHPGRESSGEKEGDNVIFKTKELSRVRYNLISIDKNEGVIRIVFYAPVDYPDCYLKINMLDDMNQSTPVNILSLKCNGIDINGTNPLEFGPFSIITNKKIVLDVVTDKKGYFGSEVKVVCK